MTDLTRMRIEEVQIGKMADEAVRKEYGLEGVYARLTRAGKRDLADEVFEEYALRTGATIKEMPASA